MPMWILLVGLLAIVVGVATTALAQRLDLLRHLIEFSDLLLLVAGPHGAGKSRPEDGDEP